MAKRRLVIFDDGQGRWGPMTDLRPVFDLRSGAWTNRQRIEHALGNCASALITSRSLAPLLAEQTQATVNPANAKAVPPRDGEADAPWLLVNGRWLATRHINAVTELAPGQALLGPLDDLVAVCLNDVQQVDAILKTLNTVAGPTLARRDQPMDLPAGIAMRQLDEPNMLISRPWDLLAELPDTLAYDLDASAVPLAHRTDLQPNFVGEHTVKIHPEASIHPMVAFDATNGPIVIDAGVQIGAMSVIEGPVYLGQGTVVNPHTRVRSNVAAGPQCVLGGEVSYSIIHGRSNKSHAGYLGHALVGEWVNLGADTTVSNLKNTYGHVRLTLESGDEPEDSGQIKHGPIIGDYTRTAIGTRILTGSVLATATMLAMSGFAPKITRRFSFLTDAGEQAYDLGKFLTSAEAAMSRRNAHVTPALRDRFAALAGQIA